MTKAIELEWTHENLPGWDGSGTVAVSWYATHGEFACRIDEFKESEGGGFAYSVSVGSNYVRNGENEPAESFEDAEAKVVALITC